MGYSPFLNLNLSAVFVHVTLIAIHFVIHYSPFKNFTVYRIQEFLQFCSVAVSCSFSITRAHDHTAEYCLNEVYCVCFQLFVYGFIILPEKVSLSEI